MGRSKSSCLKIITCGRKSGGGDDDEVENTESKDSGGKRGWSFRKRSIISQQDISNNSTFLETKSTRNEEHLEPPNIDFPSQRFKPVVSEKISLLQLPNEGTHTLSNDVGKPVFDEKTSVSEVSDEVIYTLSTGVSKPSVTEKVSESEQVDEVEVQVEAEEIPLSTEENRLDDVEIGSEFRELDEPTPVLDEVSSNLSDPISPTEEAIENAETVSDENSSTIDSSTTMVSFIKVDLNLEEPVAVVVQAAIRGYLAKRAFLKLKNVVKLQAAFRGLLVRRQAVGSLICVQAIVKMQALVRARHAKSLEGSVIEEKLDEQEKSYQRPSGKVDLGTQTETNYSSTQSLLTNVFARQLLESTPKKKQIRIKYDASRDSSWKWFDRWTTVSSSKYKQPHDPKFNSEYENQVERIDTIACEVGLEVPPAVSTESTDLTSNVTEMTMPIPDGENSIDAENLDFQVSQTISSSETAHLSQLEDGSSNQESNISSNIDRNELNEDSEQHKSSERNDTSEKTETETSKASDFAFIAAKSKLEELSLRTISGRSLCQDDGLEMKLDSPVFQANKVAIEEHVPTENLVSQYPRLYVEGSECGTELSISSTLDSPDRFEIRVEDFGNETKVAVDVDENTNGETDIPSNPENLEVDNKNDFVSEPISPDAPVSSLLPVEDGNKESVDSSETPNKDQKPVTTAPDVQTQLEAIVSQEAHQSSVNGSPGNDTATPELHETPSSKVSRKQKKKKVGLNGSKSIETRKSQSPSKKSPLSATPDSSARNSIEKSMKDPKIVKKRISFGSGRSDHVDVEARDSNVSRSNSLPSYMQATESARAKAHPSSSPRSSSAAQEKDIYIKKRHSLPAINGKQGSPRTKASTPQKQLGANENRANENRANSP